VSSAYVAGLLKRLGIAEEMKPKLRPTAGGGTTGPVAAVASGEADIVVAGIAVILAGTGVELAGWLPPELQSYLVFTAGISALTGDPNASRALLNALSSPAAVAAFKSAGIEPVRP
jgi:molybdate transport system substrate-binding protein